MRNKYPNGLTIRELKKLLVDWAEEYPNGEDTTVWIGYNNLSSQVKEVWTLDLEANGAACMLLETD
jgi:hypothetical protein